MKAEKSITNSTSSSRNRNDGVTGNAYLEWKIDTVTNLIFRPTFRYSTADRRGASYQKSWSGEEELNEKESSNWSESSQYSLALMLQVNRKLNTRGRNVALKLDYGTNASTSDRLIMPPPVILKPVRRKY